MTIQRTLMVTNGQEPCLSGMSSNGSGAAEAACRPAANAGAELLQREATREIRCLGACAYLARGLSAYPQVTKPRPAPQGPCRAFRKARPALGRR